MMIELVEANWIVAVAALLLGLLVAWFLFHAGRRTRVTGARRDVLDEGAAPAQRNSALIDAPPAAAAAGSPLVPPATPEGVGAVGAAVASAVEQAQAVRGDADDLGRIKGVGPKIVAQLHALGVTRFAQIAAWDDAEIDRIDAQMGRFQGRIRRDDWVGQARLLAAGDEAGYAGRYGNLG